MKAKQIPTFIEWLKVLQSMDNRLTVADFNKLFKIYSRSVA